MAYKPGRFLWVSVSVMVLLICAVALGLIPINLFFAKNSISEWVLENAGWKLDVDGPMRLRLGPRPTLSASVLSFTNANQPGGPLVQADKLLVRTRVLSVLRKKVDIRSLQISGIAVDYCHGQDCELDFLPERLNLRATAPLDQALTVKIDGRNSSGDVELNASGDSLTQLLDDPDKYSFDLNLQAFSSTFDGNGTLRNPLSNAQLSGQFEIESSSLSALLQNFGIEVKNLGEFSAHSALAISASEIAFQNLEGTLDEKQFSLNGLVRNSGSRPWIELDGQLSQLDLQRLSADGDENEHPDAGFDPFFDLLGSFDGRFSLQLGRLLNAPIAVDELALQARLDRGLLTLDRADVFLSGTHLEANGELETGLPCPSLASQILLHDADLQVLNQWLKPGTELGGKAGQILLDWNSCGRTADAHLSSMQLQSEIDRLILQSKDNSPPIAIDKIQLSTSWAEPGHASLHARFLDEELAFELGFGSIESMHSGADWPLAVSALGSDSRVVLNGEAALRENGLKLDIDIDIQVDRFGSLHWLGANPECLLPLFARSRLAFGTDGTIIEDLSVRVGSSDIRGRYDWYGPDKPQPMNFKGRSSKVDIRELASLFVGSAQDSTNGGSELMDALPETDWINKWLRFPPANIDLGIAEVTGINYTVTELELQAQLRDRQVNNGHLKFQLRNAEVDGLLNMDFRDSPGNASFEAQLDKVDIGGALADMELAEGIEMQAKQLLVKSLTQGDTLRALAENLQIQATAEALQWDFTTGPENRSNRLDLEQLDLVVYPGSQTTGQSRGTINGVPLRAYMKLPSRLDIFDRSRKLPLTLVIGTGNDIAMLEGTFNRRTPGNRHATFTLSGEFTGQEGLDLSTLESPLSEYELNGELSWRENEFLLNSLQVNIGKSEINGFVGLRHVAPRYLLDVDLTSPFLETNDLVQWAEDYRETAGTLTKQKDTNPNGEAINPGIIALISQQFETFAEKFDFKIKAHIDELRSAGALLGKSRLESHSQNDDFQLMLDTELDGGNINANYRGTNSIDGSEYSLDLHIERLEYGGLIRLLDADSKGGGQVHVDTTLVSRAPGPGKLTNHLEGNFDMLVIPEDIEATFLDLWASNLVFALLPKGDNNKKKMNCMVARFDVEDGIMTSKNTFLDSTDVIVRARGEIDLVKRELNLVAAPQAKLERFLSVQTPIRVTGPFEDPSIGVAPIGFVGTMLRWYYGLIYVPWKWLTGERFPKDGMETCFNAMEWEIPGELSAGKSPP